MDDNVVTGARVDVEIDVDLAEAGSGRAGRRKSSNGGSPSSIGTWPGRLRRWLHPSDPAVVTASGGRRGGESVGASRRGHS